MSMSLKPIAGRIIAAFSRPRFGVIHDDGRFTDLTGVRNYADHPLAHRARWVGGDADAELLRAAFLAYDLETLS